MIILLVKHEPFFVVDEEMFCLTFKAASGHRTGGIGSIREDVKI